MDIPPLWQDGWFGLARRVDSPNHGPRPEGACIDLIVIHSISLPPGCFDGDAVEALFTNRLDTSAHPYYEQLKGLEVSAHFFIRRNGEIVQFVSTARRAWHAGRSAYRGRENCNDDSVGIELEGLEGGLFEPAQYLQLARLCQALGELFPIRYLAGHEHVAPGRKLDPGPGFDWGQLMTLSRLPHRYFPEGCAAATAPYGSC